MFARWGDLVYRLRFTVIGIMVAGLLGFAAYGLDLNDHLSQSGWDDPGSESAQAAQLADKTFGRDTSSDVIVLYTPPEGTTVDDPDFTAKVTDSLNSLVADHPDQIAKINGSYFKVDNALSAPALATADKSHAIASIAIVGDNDTDLTNNYQDVADAFYIDGVDVQVTGLQAVAGALQSTMAGDIHRMELLAIPAVAILLFFIFGGVVAAALPLIVGGLTVIGANGIVKVFTNFTEVNSFVAPVVSLVGLGLAIDYGLFIVSRFREELGDGYTTQQAVRRTVMTAGRTVVFSATMIVASLGGLLLFPQGFLKSVAYGSIATVALAALTAITILPAMLSILGPRVDALGLKFMRKTKSSEEIENGMWGTLTRWVMKHPLQVTIPIVLGLVLLTLPVGNIKFGGINETYLPPDNITREAQGEFDVLFPGLRTEPLKLVISNAQGATLADITKQANEAPGLIEKFTADGASKDGVIIFKAGLVDRNDSKPAIDFLRSIDVPDGASVMVTGTPAIEQDSISALIDNLPLMAILVVLIVTLLMFLTFGSLVLPIKAVLMTTLGLGATMGILTWIFIDGNGASFMNFTPGPIMAPVLVLIISIVFGLSTDYEVFLLSRMVEAREKGASTSEAIRIGTSHTGRIITAAALILIVVTGAFAFSDLVMMKYIAYGMIAALIIDATLIRMFLVPATMKLLGDDCWWAPKWMKRIQQKLGLGETILEDELILGNVPEVALAGGMPSRTVGPPIRPRVGEPLTEPIPVVSPHSSGPIRATHAAKEESRRSATGRPARASESVQSDQPGLGLRNPVQGQSIPLPDATPPVAPRPAARPLQPSGPRADYNAPQNNAVKNGSARGASAQNGSAQNSPAQGASAQNGSAQNSPAQGSASPAGSGSAGSGPVGSRPAGSGPSSSEPRTGGFYESLRNNSEADRPHVEPEPTQQSPIVPPAPHGRNSPTPDPRSIESWLADLRAPSPTPPHTDPVPPQQPSSAPYGSGANGSGANGSGANGSGANGSGANRSGANRSGTGYKGGATSTPPPATPPSSAPVPASRPTAAPSTAGSRNDLSRNGSTGSGSVGNGSAGNGSAPYGSNGNISAHNGSAHNGSAGNGSAGNSSAPYGSSATGSGSNGSADHRPPEANLPTEANRPSGSSRADWASRVDEASGPASSQERSNGAARDDANTPQSSSTGRRRAEDRAESDGADSGRHRGGDDRRALSVSELLARERNS